MMLSLSARQVRAPHRRGEHGDLPHVEAADEAELVERPCVGEQCAEVAEIIVIDGGSTDFGDDHERRLRVRSRWTLASRVFTQHIRKQPRSRLTRAIIATVARAFDAASSSKAGDNATPVVRSPVCRSRWCVSALPCWLTRTCLGTQAVGNELP